MMGASSLIVLYWNRTGVFLGKVTKAERCSLKSLSNPWSLPTCPNVENAGLAWLDCDLKIKWESKKKDSHLVLWYASKLFLFLIFLISSLMREYPSPSRGRSRKQKVSCSKQYKCTYVLWIKIEKTAPSSWMIYFFGTCLYSAKVLRKFLVLQVTKSSLAPVVVVDRTYRLSVCWKVSSP